MNLIEALEIVREAANDYAGAIASINYPVQRDVARCEKIDNAIDVVDKYLKLLKGE